MSKRNNDAQDDLFGDGARRRAEPGRLGFLYEHIRMVVEVNPKELSDAALRDGVWEIIPEWEANVLLHEPDCAQWMNARRPDGTRNAYKTPDRGRLPFHECYQNELELDIWEKVQQGVGDRTQARNDIANFVLAFKQIPRGPRGERLPKWMWDEEDSRYWLGRIINGPDQPSA